MRVAAFDDLRPAGAGTGGGRGQLRPPIAAVGVDPFDEREQAARTARQLDCAVAVLYIGRVDDKVQQEAARVDENVPLAARDLLARVKALRIERRAPF